MVARFGARRRLLGSHGLHSPAQQLNGIFALISVMLAKVIQQPAFAFHATALIPPAINVQLFLALQLWLHLHSPFFRCLFPVRQRIVPDTQFTAYWVSFILRQVAPRPLQTKALRRVALCALT